MNYSQPIDLIWPIAELLRHDYKRSDYGKVVLPLTVLRRLDCVLAPTKAKVLKAVPDALKKGEKAAELLLNKNAGQAFHNRSPYDFARLLDEPNQLEKNLKAYINGFSANIREIMEYFSFAEHIVRLDKANLLFKVVSKFGEVDLHPDKVDNHDMGAVYEELIRRFSELSNETAGEHFTPREVIKLMVNLLFLEDRQILRRKGIVKKLYDPACGTGGMLSVAEDYLRELNPSTDKEPGGRLELFGQEINPESYAICKADMVIKGNNAGNIKFGNSFTTDGLPDERFDYMLSNPPFGVEWKKVEEFIRDEHKNFGHAGRFGAGLPRISDGSLLFLQHMFSKRKEGAEGTRLGIVFNGSPLFSGGAGSGESEIRRWIIEHDWLEAIVAMPDQLFYNTGISTYIWIVTNRKSAARKGKVQLVNAAGFFHKMDKSLGNKRNKIGDGTKGKPDQIGEITRIYGDFRHNQTHLFKVNGEAKAQIVSKVLDNADFGYRRITVERPLRLQVDLSDDALARLSAACEQADEAPLANLIALVSSQTGEGPHWDYNEVWRVVEAGADEQRVKLTAKREKLFRESCCMRNEAAEKVVAEHFVAELLPGYDFENMPLFGEHYSEGEFTHYEADPALRDFENVPLKEDIKDYFRREVLPHVPDAWINADVRDELDDEVGKVGYEIPFTRHFYEYKQPPKLEEIGAQIIELEEQIREKLKQQTIINQAAMRGLDPSVKLRPSGIDWLGEIPAHWEIQRIVSFADKITNGYVGPTRDLFVPKGVKYLQSLHIKSNHIQFYPTYFVSEEWSREHEKSILREDDVLIVQTGDIGQVAVVPKEFDGANCHALIIVSTRKKVCLGKYLALCLNSDYGFHSLKAIQTSALHPHLNCTLVREIKIPIPPVEEQRKIIDYVDENTASVESITLLIQEQIGKLVEYRQALISAAITGKIDVRGVRDNTARQG